MIDLKIRTRTEKKLRWIKRYDKQRSRRVRITI